MVDSQVKIDEIDVKILKTLLKDARTSFADIARNCASQQMHACSPHLRVAEL
jgi:DNA-binding Lrp family transcriptional regulator